MGLSIPRTKYFCGCFNLASGNKFLAWICIICNFFVAFQAWATEVNVLDFVKSNLWTSDLNDQEVGEIKEVTDAIGEFWRQ